MVYLNRFFKNINRSSAFKAYIRQKYKKWYKYPPFTIIIYILIKYQTGCTERKLNTGF